MLTPEYLAEVRRHSIEGRYKTFLDQVMRMLADEDFSAANPEIKASVYRLAARAMLITASDVKRAREFAALASALNDDEPMNVLEADITLTEMGPEAALGVLKYHGIDSAKTRAAYLMFAGRPAEGLRALEAVSDGSQDADVHRVLALLRTATGQYAAAEREAERALSLDPRSMLVQQTAGVVKFYACYPIVFLPRQLVVPADPIPADLLNRDPVHIVKLEEAVQHFDNALGAVDVDHDQHEVLKLWRLGALAANPQRRAAASDYAAKLLSQDTPIDQAVQWSKMFDLGVHEQWIIDAERAVAFGDERPTQRLMLGWLKIEDQQYDSAVTILMSGTEGETPSDKTERKVLLSRAFIEQRQPDDAIAALQGESGPDVHRILGYFNRVKLQGEPDIPDAAFLDICRKKAHDGDWEFIAARSKQLLADFPSRLAIRLVLHAFYNTKRYVEFLRLYDEAAQWTGLDKDSSTRRARSLSLWHHNDRAEALAATKNLFQEEPTAETGRVYAYMLFEGGDTNAIAAIVPQLRDARDLTPEIALEIAHALQSSHSHEAATLWDKAVALGIPDDYVAQALGIAYRVGREQQTEELIHRMQELAVEGKAGISQANYQQVIELVERSRERSAEYAAKYRNGDVPIHAIADLERLPLFVTHDIEPALNRNRPPLHWNSIYIRAGNRGAVATDVQGRRLLLDITSLILAHYLGVLQRLQDEAKELVVPAETTALLHNMHERISAAQPGRVRFVDHVLRAISGRMITVVPKQNQFEWALNANGYFVTSLPRFDVKRSTIEEIDDRFKPATLNLHRLVDALRSHQLLSEWEKDSALRVLGSEGLAAAVGPAPERGSKLLFDAAHIELMQEAQLIRPLVNGGYRLFVTTETQAYLQSQAQEAARRGEAAGKLRLLIEAVRDGIDSGKIVPRRTQVDGIESLDHGTRALASLMESAAASETLVVDDRFCNRPTHTDSGAPVVSVLDCLAGIKDADRIDGDTYYQVIHVARSSGLLFIPLSVGELIYHLMRAEVRVDSLVESNELRTLRAYLGGALRQPGIHLVPHGNYDERQYLRDLDSALRTAIERFADDPPRRDYLISQLEAAEIAAIRGRLDSGDNEAALQSLEALVQRYVSP